MNISSTWKAAVTSAALSGLFFIVYPLCNWIASRRPHVASFYFHWEQSIPFIPVFIIPYASINFFFVAAPFLAKSDRQRLSFAKRIAAAMFISAICFVLIPLRFAFTRPQVHGFLGLLFNSLHAFDRPFNQFPSLHIAFCVILADMYLRHCGRILRFVLAIWFVLIGLSTLFTYQHHAVDILGGIAVAAICLALFRDKSRHTEQLDQPYTESAIS